MLKKLSMLCAGLLFVLLPYSKVQAASGPNLITNPGVEEATGVCPDGVPTGWSKTSWSTNTVSQTYDCTGHNSAHSLKTEITALGTGADGWQSSPIAVTAGQPYEYSFWYQSSVGFQVDVTDATSDAFITAFAVPASGTWTQFKTTYAPTATTSIILTNYLTNIGYVNSDDFSLTTYTPEALNRPIVSVTFDDGWANQYTNAFPIMQANNIKGTFYLISQPLQEGDGAEYMNATQANAIFAAGNEIGGHSIDHCSLNGTTKDAACPDPTTMTTEAAAAFITNEMQASKTAIESLVPGAKVDNFAYPYGEYSAQSISIGNGIYKSQRTIECGTNTKDLLNLSKLRGCEVDANVTVAQTKAWIDQAIAEKSWIILFYHEVANAGQGVPGDEPYTTTVADFQAIMEYIKSRSADIDVKTVAQAIAAIGNTTTPPAVKPGDVNGDNTVDALDLSTVLSNWEKTSATRANGDVNGDTVVDALDLSIVLVNWSN